MTIHIDNRRSFAQLQSDAEGKWPYIFQDLAPELAEAMEKAPHHVPCPVHGGTDGFRLFRDWQTKGNGYCNTCLGIGNGFKMVAWIRGYSMKDATRDIAKWLRNESMEPTIARRPPPPKVPVVIDRRKAYGKIRDAWMHSLPLRGTPAEKYLAQRGIWKQNMPPSLRAHPGLKYWDKEAKKLTGPYPCLIAPIKDKDGRIISLHRIFLTDEGGKANVAEPKKMMTLAGEVRGAAIKLHQAGDVLGVAEGIETALAAYAISRMPMWSCVSATLMELVDIPESVRKVVIWADLDRSGRGKEAAETLAKRLREAGKEVEICMPQGTIPADQKGIDWLDVLLTQGLDGFPAHWRRWNPELDRQAA
ncbi:toprim domain-containing protein [Burkholderia cenocepacia]|uniref:DUF7146 domain-containing protein n=1 Tax=Burkholderia cenocepacia TaxID=95486 RepID=UPI000761AE3F|nr:toprim domain-containing protein [Burkholderia cenocepacia]KWU24778.1 hypothetical protein AS149_32040 [Burkholderia cenocepacia]